jgi:aspartyl-tRNA(Asn)/glutamyl-tRNA(Gln) amidotransferase subunit B
VEERFTAGKRIDLLSFGGAIAGKKEGDVVVPGELTDLRSSFAAEPSIGSGVRVEAEALGSFLSEEISPAEWSVLVSAVAARLSPERGADGASAVVIGHGTDTLPYTAPLLHWLFGRSAVQVALAASSSAPASAAETVALLKPAALRALESTVPGVVSSVSAFVDGSPFPAVNLKFARVGSGGFATWNAACLAELPKPFDSASALAELSEEEIRKRIEAATRSLMVVKIHPCLRAELFGALISAGCTNFILELYDTGTAPGGASAYSLRDAIRAGKEKGAAFYCTSQQEGVVDFSGYVTAHELWKEGAVPMGPLITESAYARFVAAWLVAGDESGARSLMERDEF